jgi:hypothetical protein
MTKILLLPAAGVLLLGLAGFDMMTERQVFSKINFFAAILSRDCESIRNDARLFYRTIFNS